MLMKVLYIFFKNTANNVGIDIYTLNKAHRIEIDLHCGGLQEDLVGDVNCFYSSVHDYFARTTNLIHFYFIKILLNCDLKGKKKMILFFGLKYMILVFKAMNLTV
ncbi:class I adenylate cyclase [Candidatus Hartigia pinicola]